MDHVAGTVVSCLGKMERIFNYMANYMVFLSWFTINRRGFEHLPSGNLIYIAMEKHNC